MLSLDLVELALHLSKYSATGMQLEPAGVAELVATLDAMSGDARLLEEGAPAHRVGCARPTKAPPWGWSDRVVVPMPIDMGGGPC